MRIVLLALLAACGPKKAPAPAAAPEPAPPAVKEYDAATFYDTISVFGGSFSSDASTLLVGSDASGVFNAWAYPFDGSDPKPLTTSETDAIFPIAWFPEDRRFLYSSDQGGNELSHVYVRELDGTAVDLTPGEKHRASFFGWNGDRTAFWVQSNERDPKAMDLYRYSLEEGYPRKLVFENTDARELEDISRDGRWLVIGQTNNNADSDLYLLDLNGEGEPKHITPHEGFGEHSVYTFTPDSKQLWFGTDTKGEFRQAWIHDLETGEQTVAIEADWDVSFVYFSETGRYRVHGVNADARTQVTVLDTTTDQALALPELPAGDISSVGFDRGEKRVRFYLDTDRSPRNLFVHELGTDSARRLTSTLSKDIDENDLVSSTVVRYPSFDGLEIPAVLYKPKTASADAKVPAIVWVHGGPGGQSRVGYSGSLQHLVNHGYAVLAVNNRGSSGYGKTFFHLDDRKHGQDDLQDCIYGRRYLEGLDWVDGERIGIMGGSYGGYMVGAALAFEPEAFEVGVDIFGVMNWVRTLESIPPWWEAFREALYAELGNPETDGERLRAISPLFHADKIQRPLMVVQGANDPRVLKVESDEIVAAVKEQGVPVEYLVFDDEGHGFLKTDNRIEASEAWLQFLDTHLAK